MKKITTIHLEDAESLQDDLSDLLCWWQGFRAAARLHSEYPEYLAPAQNGIDAARKLNQKIKDALLADKVHQPE